MKDLYIPVLLAFSASVATYFVSHRQNSGNIKTSEASDLWRESQEIRRELRDEVAKLRKELEECYEKCRKALRRTG